MTSHNALRTFIRQESSITKNVLDSQQIYNPENIELLLDDKVSYAKKRFKPMQENKYHTQNLREKELEQLCANIKQQNCIIQKSYMSFLMPFFSSYHIMNMKVLEA